jgi:glycosyltransferase involved in cell wall biosynthesis
MKKMKVAHIITRLIVGGAQENTLSTVLRQMNNPEFEVTLITGPGLGPEGSLEEKARQNGVVMVTFQHMRRAINPIRDTIVLSQLISHCITQKYDVIHTHSSKAGILGRIAGFLTHCPVVVHTIHGLPFHPYEKKWKNCMYILLEKFCALLSDKIITVSDTMRDKALEAGVGCREQYATIYSGMDIDAFLNSGQYRDSVRKKYNINPETVVIGKIARLFHLKGHDFVIDAARDIVKAHPNAVFLFIGGGILENDLKSRINSFGLNKNFIFTGLVPPTEIPKLVSAMDILVHTSLREGLARALPQALASGKPVVTFDIDSAHEVVEDGLSGYLVKPGDSTHFVQAVNKLVADRALREKMGAHGRSHVVPRFSDEYMADQINKLYKDILNK